MRDHFSRLIMIFEGPYGSGPFVPSLHEVQDFFTKKTPRAEKPKKPKSNTKNTQDPAIRAKFQEYVEEQLQNLDSSASDDMWNNMKSAIYDSSLRAFGTDRLSKEDWIEANAAILMPLLEKKCKIFITHNRKPTESTKQQLHAAKSNLQKETRKCTNQYWDKLCLEIQKVSDMGNIRKMYEKIRVAIGPTVSKVAPLKSVIGDQLTNKKKQTERWNITLNCTQRREMLIDSLMKPFLGFPK
ncbi:Hypothetical predicted protein [Octopus vulgaris]|uniref:Uncharacterized protein n=1 Tax=Octopus vulgaris TaxID=6645 RepID=A0AA36AWA3_OCTVU|nr:Hypothetical predicted protein [Octopus vulgaris]